MSNIAMLVVCLVAGLVLRRSGRLPDTAHSAVAALLLSPRFALFRATIRCACPSSRQGGA